MTTTLCHLKFAGDNGSTSITDDIGTAVSNNGVTISTANDPLGQGYFNGSAYLTLNSSIAAAIASGPFTVEFWVNKYSDNGATSFWGHPILSQSSSDSGGDQTIDMGSTTVGSSKAMYNIGPAISGFGGWGGGLSTTALVVGTDYHVAYIADGTNWHIYINGYLETTFARTNYWINTNNPLYVGYVHNPSYPNNDGLAKSYIWDLIISSGIKYTANFTPPSRSSVVSGTISGAERGDQGWLTGSVRWPILIGAISGAERGDQGWLTGSISLPVVSGTINGGERRDKGWLTGSVSLPVTAVAAPFSDALYLGMNSTTGQSILDADHLRQSIADILFTPIGTRVHRRDYGSKLPDLIDRPFNGPTRMAILAAIVYAVNRWEPRLTVNKVDILLGDVSGQFMLELAGTVNVAGLTHSMTINLPLSGMA
jgi:phage baseplate assembly protein W